MTLRPSVVTAVTILCCFFTASHARTQGIDADRVALADEIRTQELKREALYNLYRRDTDRRTDEDRKRDRRLRAISSTICAGCSPAPQSPKQSTGSKVSAEEEDARPHDPAQAGGVE